MDFLTSRRAGTTYGRSARRILVHDLFDQQSEHDRVDSVTSSRSSLSPARSDNYTRSSDHVTTSTKKHVGDSASFSSTSSPDPIGVSERVADKQASKNGNLFDLDTSDDQGVSRKVTKGSNKRRRVLQSLRSPDPDKSKSMAPLAQKSENMPSLHKQSKNKPTIRAGAQEQKREARVPTKKANRITAAPKADPVSTVTTQQHASTERATPRIGSTTQKALPVLGNNIKTRKDVSADTSGHMTDRSVQSTGSSSDTPKRKRLSSHSAETAVSSPGQLGMTSLKLSPSNEAIARRSSSPDSGISRDQPPRRIRSRLIDRLDAPRSDLETATDSEPKPMDAKVKKSQSEVGLRLRGRADTQQTAKSDRSRQAPVLERSQSSQTRATYVSKVRTTYAKERSHLSDMVDGLDALNTSSSQQSSQGILLPSASSNLASQLDLEDEDTDDQPAVGKLKSIHELRVAGAMNRYDRDIQAILEDIETEDSFRKSTCLQGLIKLTKRFKEDGFLRHFIHSGRVSRLTACAPRLSDGVSATVFTFLLHMLIKSQVTLQNLEQIFNAAAVLVPVTLNSDQSFSDLVQGRRIVPSKSLRQSLLDLEESILQNDVLIGYERARIFPSQIVVSCVSEALRGLLKPGHTTVQMTAEQYIELLKLLEIHAQCLVKGSNPPQAFASIEQTLSLLEMCSVAFEEIYVRVPEEHYKVLGDSLASIMRLATEEERTVEQSVLRVVVSLSNNKPRMCHLLGFTSITDSVFAVIDSNFLDLAKHAETEQTLDQGKLDAVILALGCFLNFVECDADMRLRLAQGRNEGYTYVERLVTIFNSQVSNAQEATTQEQSQVLVAFGYLSMLLCTMSLDAAVKVDITQRLDKQSFEQLCIAAETFFSHLRTLENISDQDASMSAFTARFNAILETIRRPTA